MESQLFLQTQHKANSSLRRAHINRDIFEQEEDVSLH